MMTDIHKQRDTYEHILEGKHHIWPSFFFLEEKHQRIDTCTVFFCFDRDQIANVLQNDWKEHLKIKKKIQFCLLQTFVWLGGRFLLAFWD